MHNICLTQGARYSAIASSFPCFGGARPGRRSSPDARRRLPETTTRDRKVANSPRSGVNLGAPAVAERLGRALLIITRRCS